MDILMIMIGVITIISASILLIYLIAKKKFWVLIIIIGIIIIISGILILANSDTNQKEEISQHPISGTFTVPAGQGPWESKVYVKRGERFWVASSSNIELLNCKNGKTVRITSKGWISTLVKKEGYLTFMKTNKKVEIHFKMIN